jgi:hypothetical protein
VRSRNRHASCTAFTPRLGDCEAAQASSSILHLADLQKNSDRRIERQFCFPYVSIKGWPGLRVLPGGSWCQYWQRARVSAVKAGRGRSLNYPPSQLKPADRKHGPARKVWCSRSWRFPQVLRGLQGPGVSPHMVCSRAEQPRQPIQLAPTREGDRWLTLAFAD